jgi:signal transduction histidine kinase
MATTRAIISEIALTPTTPRTNVILTKNSAPVNSHHPKLAEVRGKFSQRAAWLLFGLAVSFASARASENSAVVVSNPPAIYVGTVHTELPELTNGLGCWIWDKVTVSKQTVRLWNRFEVPKTNHVIRAELRIAADNAYKVSLDGRELGSGSDWRTLSIYHLEGTLDSGPHIVAVEGFNDNDQAGVILGLRLEMANNQVLQIRSDRTWRVVPNSENGWETALHPAADWPHASFATNFGKMPWWTIPTSVLHIREDLPKPIPFWQSREFQIGLFTGCGIFVLFCLYLLIQLVSQSKAHHLVQAERDRIARDIHDDLGSKLTQLLLTGEEAQIESAPAPGAPLLQMCDGARNILATIDEVVWIVNSQRDNLEDFVSYVCKYAQHFLKSSPIRCRFDVPQELPATFLSQFTRRNLFLAAKEALNNTAKHSAATELTVCIELNGSQLSVVVADNGCGFDSTQASQARNGLTNMKLRMAEIGGDCQVVSRPGEGCQVNFQVPLKRRSFFKSLFQSRNHDDSPGFPSHRKEASSPAETVGESSG